MPLPHESVDHYGVLGVPTTATTEEIRKGYKAAVLKTHPDKTKDDSEGGVARFRAVQEALDVLTDPRRKQAYDTILACAEAAKRRPAPPTWPQPKPSYSSYFSPPGPPPPQYYQHYYYKPPPAPPPQPPLPPPLETWLQFRRRQEREDAEMAAKPESELTPEEQWKRSNRY